MAVYSESGLGGFPAKPTPSPARTDNFPPPLVRFLSGNVGSKSSARSRSGRIFLRKKTSAVETQEPSSPKVTCMGQVRPRNLSRPRVTATERMSRWIPTAFFCNRFAGRLKWKTWASFGGKTGKSEHGDGKQGFVTSVSSTPKNASTLPRTRSAPSPSSSLANTEKEERTELENTDIKAHPVPGRDQKHRSCSQPEGRNDCHREGSTSERVRNSGGGSCFRPVILLRRSQSEPSRIRETLNPRIF